MVDPFSESTARSCMLLPLHRRCVVSDNDPDCRKYGSQKLVEVFVRQVLNKQSDIKSTDEINGYATAFVQAFASIRERKHIND